MVYFPFNVMGNGHLNIVIQMLQQEVISIYDKDLGLPTVCLNMNYQKIPVWLCVSKQQAKTVDSADINYAANNKMAEVGGACLSYSEFIILIGIFLLPLLFQICSIINPLLFDLDGKKSIESRTYQGLKWYSEQKYYKQHLQNHIHFPQVCK